MMDEPNASPTIGDDGSAGTLSDEEIIHLLSGYKSEAEDARKVGDSARDGTWRSNWQLYWNQYDHSKKAEWQSKLSIPEAPAFVDRWAGAMREALMQDGPFFTVEDPSGENEDMSQHVTSLMNYILAESGRSPQGHPLSFDATF